MRPKIINKITLIKIFITILISLYFLYYSIYGKYGILNIWQIKENISIQESHKSKILLEVKQKEQAIKSLKPESLDLDFIDEKTRESIGFIKNNEIMIKK